MAELVTLARPYAHAAFDAATEARALPAWSSALKLLAAVVENSKVAGYLASPGPTKEALAALLLSLCQGELSPSVENFVKVLAENKRLALLPVIALEFEYLKTKSEGRLKVSVSSASALGSEQQQALHEALSKKLKQEVMLDFMIDPSLIGGVVIHYDDVVIDGSVKNKLERLQVRLQD